MYRYLWNVRCIFCKADSTLSRSEEHIIPQSLGNSKHKLPRGWVCDSCNQYFSIKVEKPVLDTDYFRHARHRNAIISKKGRIPPLEVIYGPNGEELGMYLTTGGERGIYPITEKAQHSFINHIVSKKSGSIYIPEPTKAAPQLVARLMTKIALEILAKRLVEHAGWNEELVNNRQFDEIRRYARYGIGRDWSFHERRIYPEDKKWTPPVGEAYEVMNEYDVLVTPWQEYFAIICIFGVEYAVNYGGPEIDGYFRWLDEKNHASPLYFGKNAEIRA